MIRRIIQTATPYFREKRDYNTMEGYLYLRFVTTEQRRQNIVKGYVLTRLSPLKKDDKEGHDFLKTMLGHIDPCIKLKDVDDVEVSSIKAFEKFYLERFGIPGTPEFEQKIKEFNEQFK